MIAFLQEPKFLWQRRTAVRQALPSVLVLGMLVAGACSDTTARAAKPHGRPAAVAGTWTSIPESPLSPRHDPLMGALGSKVLVVGGRSTPACPPGADCAAPKAPALRDGAVYDPDTGVWTALPEAPVPVTGTVATTSTKGEIWSVQDDEGKAILLGYEHGRAWRAVPLPDPSGRRIATAGGQLVVYPGSHESGGLIPDRLFDPESGTWTDLGPDPIGSSYDRTIVGVEDGVVLLAIPRVDVPPADRPRVFHAARYTFSTEAWRLLPASSIPGYADTWYRSGPRIVNPTLGTVDGGAVNGFDRPYDLGGVLFEEATWLPLPPFRELPVGSGSSPVAANERWAVSSAGPAETPLAVLNLERLSWSDAPTTSLVSRTGTGRVVIGDRLLLWGGADFDLPAPRGRLHNDGQQLELT